MREYSKTPLKSTWQRQRGRVTENVTVAEYTKNEQVLRTVSSIRINTTKGNTRGNNEHEITVSPNDYKPLCKRRKARTIGTKYMSFMYNYCQKQRCNLQIRQLQYAMEQCMSASSAWRLQLVSYLYSTTFMLLYTFL